MMIVAEFDVRPDTLTKTPPSKTQPVIETADHDTRPPAFAMVQALSQPLIAEDYDPFEAYGDAQPSDRGYDDYCIDPMDF